MNTTTAERLYALIPAIYRLRDADQGEPLRALLGVIETELQLIESDIARLYDNWFIETCDEWVLPYIGDLLGVRGLLAGRTGAFTQRGLVANTIALRQGKGTAATLEQVARDVTGWPSKAVEFFQILATTQHLNHVRLLPHASVNLRDIDSLALIDGAFDRSAHTIDVRHIDDERGRFNIPYLGIFLWRLQSYPLTRVSAASVVSPPDGRFTFDPLGRSIPLFNQPLTESNAQQSMAEIDVPAPLRKLPLYEELETLRQALADGQPSQPVYFGPDPVLQVYIQGSADPVRAEQILICDLRDPPSPATDWQRPPAQKTYLPASGNALGSAAHVLPITVAVDPELGRLVFPAGVVPTGVEVSYAYGFSGDLGGGPYNRQDSVVAWSASVPEKTVWQKGVTQAVDAVRLDPDNLVTTLAEAIQQWNAQPAGTAGIIAVMDSRSYVEDLTGANTIVIHEGSALLIVAADWPHVQALDVPSQRRRLAGQITPHGVRPVLKGSVATQGDAPAASVNPGSLTVNGLLIDGAVSVLPGNLGELSVVHSTLAPTNGGITVPAGGTIDKRNDGLAITLRRSITGPVTLADTVLSLSLQDCIVDAGSDAVAAITGPATDVQTSTIRGMTIARSLNAGNSIFTGSVAATRRQIGCMRFCYVPPASRTPRRFRCLPVDTTMATNVVPQFTTMVVGQPGYAQLTLGSATGLDSGAADEGEMGALSFLQQTQRLNSLRARLAEYLRFGLEAGEFFSS